MIPDRAWVLLKSGRRLDLLQPEADSWTDRDLAIGLSRTYRWGGHSRWELPLSVAQHSLTVMVLREQMNAGPALTRAEALRELLHDGDEGLLGYDVITPLKPHLGDGFKAVTDRLRAVINKRYQLEPWAHDDYILHKRADHLAAASEAYHVTGWDRAAIRESLQITLDPAGDDPLPVLDGMQPWEPWPPGLAAALFLAKLQELTRPDQVLERPADLSAVIEREQTIRRLADSFSRLPAHRRKRGRRPPTGSSLSDTYVVAEAGDCSQCVEGIVVDGERDNDGQWDFDADFTIFTTDEDLLVCHGYNCHVDVQ